MPRAPMAERVAVLETMLETLTREFPERFEHFDKHLDRIEDTIVGIGKSVAIIETRQASIREDIEALTSRQNADDRARLSSASEMAKGAQMAAAGLRDRLAKATAPEKVLTILTSALGLLLLLKQLGII